MQGAARADGLAIGAWLGQLAVRTASARVGVVGWELGMSRAEVVGALVRVRLDVSLALRLIEVIAASENPTGGIPAPEAEVARVSRAALAQLDALIDQAVGDVPA